jgi:glycosyltransferase involved in cell wall biosynthesis
MIEYLRIYPKNNKILIVGTYPPPLGGVSVHIHRLYSLLKANQREVDVFDTSRFYGHKFVKLLILYLKIKLGTYKIVHLQNTGKQVISLILKLKNECGFQLFFTDHNPRLFLGNDEEKREFYRNFLHKVDLHIVVSPQVLLNYKEYGVNLKKNPLLINAFISPPAEDENKIFKLYDKSLKRFISIKRPLLTANAYRLSFLNSIDLYGLDMCIELMAQLVNQFPDSGLLFALADSKYNKEYLKKCYRKINEHNLTNNIYLLKKKQEIWPIIKRSNIFLRPTISDGDSVSIREALFFNCTVIASDIADRPDNVILFKSRSQEDFLNKVTTVCKGKII